MTESTRRFTRLLIGGPTAHIASKPCTLQNAVETGLAACFAVGVVEPESIGIGGGHMVFQIEDRGDVIGFPVRGPLKAFPNMFQLTGEASVVSFGWVKSIMAKTSTDTNQSRCLNV